MHSSETAKVPSVKYTYISILWGDTSTETSKSYEANGIIAHRHEAHQSFSYKWIRLPSFHCYPFFPLILPWILLNFSTFATQYSREKFAPSFASLSNLSLLRFSAGIMDSTAVDIPEGMRKVSEITVLGICMLKNSSFHHRGVAFYSINLVQRERVRRIFLSNEIPVPMNSITATHWQ